MNARLMVVSWMTVVALSAPMGSVTSARSVERATVSVTNQNTLDVDVFAVIGSSRQRLGTVVTSQTAAFDLPGQAVGASVRLAADPVGSRETYVSGPLTISDGTQVNMVVANRLAQSTVSVGRVANH